MIKEVITELEPITVDTVRTLRLKGNVVEAQNLIRQYRADVKKSGLQTVKNIMTKDLAIKHHLKICCSFKCLKPAKKGYRSCKEHLLAKRNSNRKMRLRLKELKNK